MQRELPPKIKIYEALWAIADNRLEIIWLLENEAKCYYSSSGNKWYIVQYDAATNSIMTNDNASYRKWYLGYPAITFLMKKWILKYDTTYADALKDIPRKDINQKFNNDFAKTTEYIHEILQSKWIDIQIFLQEIDDIYKQIEDLKINILWQKIKPPVGY